MMYNQKLVASLKANGKILREFKDTVYCQFGAEYSILLKNLNTVRALVNIYIDGENQTPGGLVLNAHQEVDLQRSIKNGNLMEGNKFKFIERTGAVEQHRGIKLEDGLIRVEYQFEKVYQQVTTWGINKRWVPGHYEDDGYYTSPNLLRSKGLGQPIGAGEILCSTNISASASLASDNSAQLMNVATAQTSFNDVGITVAGSKSDQKFHQAGWFPTEAEKYSIVLKLLGETEDNKPVLKTVTTKYKPKCVTCGKQNKATAKFCTECGTALTIYA